MTDAKTPGQAIERRGTLLEKLAAKYMPNTPKGEVLAILNATAFKTKDGPPTNAQVAALLVVADQYNLNPWTREIFAFPDKQNGIVPVVGIDGWNRIANEHPQYQGETLELPPRDEWERIDEDAKLAPPYMTVTVYRKDREHPTTHTEYLDECYRPAFSGSGRDGKAYKKSGAWQSHTKRMLEHKTRIQGRRIAFGFAGIYDEDEAERIVEARYDVEAEAVEVEVIGEDGWAQLLGQAEAAGLTADDLLANAAALGHEGPGPEMPREIAGKLWRALTPEDPDDGPDEPATAPEDAEAATDPGEDAGTQSGPQEAEEQPPGVVAAEFRRARREETAERLPSEMAADVAAKAADRAANRKITAAQANKVYTQCTVAKVDDDELYEWLGDVLGVGAVEAIPAARLDEVLAWVKGHAAGKGGAA